MFGKVELLFVVPFASSEFVEGRVSNMLAIDLCTPIRKAWNLKGANYRMHPTVTSCRYSRYPWRDFEVCYAFWIISRNHMVSVLSYIFLEFVKRLLPVKGKCGISDSLNMMTAIFLMEIGIRTSYQALLVRR